MGDSCPAGDAVITQQFRKFDFSELCFFE